MSDVRRNRILVLENDTFLLDLYARHLRRAGFEVVKADNLMKALGMVEQMLFGAAVVDLMLDDPVAHDTYEGQHLLRACQELGEGTQCIISSAQDKTRVAAELTKQYAPFAYIDKAEIGGNVDELLSTVLDATQAAPFGDLSSPDRLYVQVFGRNGEDSVIAETRLTAFLKPPSGPLALRKGIFVALSEAFPLCPLSNSSGFWKVDQQANLASNVFWSKGLGHAVEISISREELGAVEGERLRGHASWLNARARHVDRSRDEFGDRLSSELWELAGLSGGEIG